MIDLFFYPKNVSGKLFKTYLKLRDHPSKVRIQNIIGSGYFKKGIQVCNKDGLVFQLAPNDWITRIIIHNGCYEKQSIHLAQNILKNGGVFFDIGANFGLFSCILSKQTNVTTYSFEPNYEVMNKLIRNIKINDLDNNITVLNTALSDKSKLVFFSVKEDNNIGTGRYDDNKVLPKQDGIYIATISLNEVINYLDVSYITLIKIDIEGNEMDVFNYFDFNKIPVYNIIMEFNENTKISFAELKTFFGLKGYKVKNINGELIEDEKEIIENNIWVSKI